MKSRLAYALYLLAMTLVLLVAVEYGAMLANRSAGVRLLFLIAAAPEAPRFGKFPLFNRLDPHLGYAHLPAAIRRPVEIPHHVLPGFVLYDAEGLQDTGGLKIVALGGSTTDPWMYGHSWPEELAERLAAAKIPAQVFNGGVGGYSSNQELLKLIRDVLELDPDVVLTYDGLNDATAYAQLPNPMVHPYQRRVLAHLVGEHHSRLAPNAVFWLRGLLRKHDGSALDVTLGVGTRRSSGEFLVRNLDIMQQVCGRFGITYFAFIQPVVGVGEYQMTTADRAGLARHGREYLESLRAVYATLQEAAADRPYIIDLRDVFSSHEGVYKDDAQHLTKKGNQIIAETVLKVLESRLFDLPPEAASPDP